MSKRAIVVAQPFISHPTAGVPVPIKFEGEELRKYLMFWDEIEYPSAPMLEQTSNNPDLKYLSEVGVIKRHELQNFSLTAMQGVPLSLYVAFAQNAQQEAFEKRSKDEPGVWSMSEIAQYPLVNYGEPSMAVEIQLYNMLPVPTKDVPLAEILEFKEKRYSELVALRFHLDELYEKIQASELVDRAKQREIYKLEESLRDIDRTLHEAGINTRLTSLRSYLTTELLRAVNTGLQVVGATAIFATAATPVVAAPLAVLGGAAALHLIIQKVMTPKNAPNKHPFLYLNSMKKELK